MSRLPQHLYGYHTHTAVPTNYYFDETEVSYDVGDYSESEGLSETPPHAAAGTQDITDLYRRKIAVKQQQRQQHQERYEQHPFYCAHDYYYYDSVPPHVIRSTGRQVPGVYARRAPPPTNERLARYYAVAEEDEHRRYGAGAMAYRSSPQIAQARPTTARPVPSSTVPQAIRRHPVTVRTPRYFRRPQATSLRKPSTLCLPVNCQPDPAVAKKTRSKILTEQTYQAETNPTHVNVPDSITMQPDPQGDADAVLSDVDNMLNKYERIFSGDETNTAQKKERCGPLKSTTTVSTKTMKPRIPPCIKAKQERLQKFKEAKSNKSGTKPSNTSVSSKGGRVEVEEITTEVLDQLLAELMNSGCENKLKDGKAKDDKKTVMEESKKEKASKSSGNTDTSRQMAAEAVEPKSVNYQEISLHLFEEQQERDSKMTQTRKIDVSSQVSPKEDTNSLCPQSDFHHQTAKVYLEEALELHKSKSYIVNLIDRALSKELGTLPEMKYKEPHCVSGTVSMDTMKPQLKADRDLCSEIHQALTESFVSNAARSVESKHELCCSCLHQKEEPLCLRQLRQLRWGHLKHIQREVRRLEDIERFIDSCSSTSNF